METNNNTGKIILVVVLLAAAIYWFTTMKPQGVDNTNNEMSDDVSMEDSNSNEDFDVAKSICYEWKTDAGDRAEINVELMGTDVSGEFNWLPLEKDSKTGTFKGTSSPLELTKTVMWQASGEGVTNTEELKLKFSANTVAPGFGAMEDKGDGVYVYSDPANISYDLTLTEVNCK